MAKAKKKPQTSDEPLVNPFAARHGDYSETTISLTAGEFPDEPSHKQKRVTINRGGTTVQRWVSSGSLNESEISAIAHYCRAWHCVHSEQRITANLSPMAFVRTSGDAELRQTIVIQASELLGLLDERIFDLAPPYYKSVWQDIVIFDRSAHEVGGNNRASADRAKTICLFIADMIATVLRL